MRALLSRTHRWKQHHENKKTHQFRTSRSLSPFLRLRYPYPEKELAQIQPLPTKNTLTVYAVSYKPIRVWEKSRAEHTNTRPKVERLYLSETFSTNGGKVAKTNLCFIIIYFQSLVIHDPTFEEIRNSNCDAVCSKLN